METLLSSCGMSNLESAFLERGLASEDKIAACSASDLAFLKPQQAQWLIQMAQERQLFRRRKVVVKRTWKIVEDLLGDDTTKVFYKLLFEKYPEIKDFYKNTVSLDVQSSKLYMTLSLAVRYLDGMDCLDPLFERLGRVHAKLFQCQQRHYQAVGECLLLTLETALGDEWTEEVAEAWDWLYHTIANKMVHAGEQHRSMEEFSVRQCLETKKGCADLAFQHRRIDTIRNTWRALNESMGVQVVQLFHHRLSNQYPELYSLLDEETKQSDVTLFKTVSLVVNYLDRIECLNPFFQKLGQIYAQQLNCNRKCNDALGECLLWTLKTGLGGAWSPVVADAWSWLYTLVIAKMNEGGDNYKLSNTYCYGW